MANPKPHTGPGSNLFVCDAPQLEKYVRELADKAKTVAERNGKLRARLKDILKKEGYHRVAMANIRQIDAMSETELADFMRTFKPMFEAMYAEFWKPFIDNDLLAGAGENVTKLPVKDDE